MCSAGDHQIAPMEFSSANLATWAQCSWLRWATHRPFALWGTRHSVEFILRLATTAYWVTDGLVLPKMWLKECCESLFASSDVSVQSISIPSCWWCFGQRIWLIWVLAASCFHWECFFYEGCCFRGFPNAHRKAHEPCFTLWGFCVTVVKFSCLVVFVWISSWVTLSSFTPRFS